MLCFLINNSVKAWVNMNKTIRKMFKRTYIISNGCSSAVDDKRLIMMTYIKKSFEIKIFLKS